MIHTYETGGGGFSPLSFSPFSLLRFLTYVPLPLPFLLLFVSFRFVSFRFVSFRFVSFPSSYLSLSSSSSSSFPSNPLPSKPNPTQNLPTLSHPFLLALSLAFLSFSLPLLFLALFPPRPPLLSFLRSFSRGSSWADFSFTVLRFAFSSCFFVSWITVGGGEERGGR